MILGIHSIHETQRMFILASSYQIGHRYTLVIYITYLVVYCLVQSNKNFFKYKLLIFFRNGNNTVS